MMQRLATIPLILAAACATTRDAPIPSTPAMEPPPTLSSDAPGPPASVRAAPRAAESVAPVELLPLAWQPVEPWVPAAALASAPADDGGLRESRFTLKGGGYGSTEDQLDDGFIFNVSWMRFFTSLIALELEVGYLNADGSGSVTETEAWGIPVMVNGRLNLPVWVLDLYGGIGVGGFYYDYETKVGGMSVVDSDGWLWGGNGFLGATINVVDRIAVGLEGKYYVTEEFSDINTTLDAWAVMLTVGFRR